MSETQFGRKVGWASFFCCMVVILHHSGNAALFFPGSDSSLPLAVFQDEVVYSWIRWDVPFFLMLSGYLFFRGFTLSKLKGKWLRRVRSLFIPYILWNTLYYLLYLLVSNLPFLGEKLGFGHIFITPGGVFGAVFLYRYNPVFWFMFQLILLTILAPVFYLLLKDLRTACAAGLVFSVFVFRWVLFPVINLDAVLYYAVSCFAALHLRRYAEAGWSRSRVLAGIFFLLFGLAFRAAFYRTIYFPLVAFYHICFAAGIWLLIPEQILGPVKPWAACTFFFYAFHYIPVRLFGRVFAAVFPENEAAALFCYWIMPALAAFACFQAAKLLKIAVPRLYRLLNGGRG